MVDTDYTYNRLAQPVIRLYCKNIENSESVVIYVLGFEPYFYVDNCGLDIFELQKRVETVLKGYVKRVDIVTRFRPIGYQINKVPMLRVVLFNPKATPEARELLKKEISEIASSMIYEADIVFANRFLVDMDINGMDIIEFNEKGKELRNPGIQCNKIYLCEMKDIKTLKNEMVAIEY